MSEIEQLIIELRKRWGADILRISLTSGIPQALFASIALQESYPKLYKYSVRLEDHLFREFYAMQKLSGPDVLMASSSHGLTQVLGCYSTEYKILGRSKTAGVCGIIHYNINDFYDKPFEVCAAHLVQVANAMPLIQKQDFRKVAKLYNSGNPESKLKSVIEYADNIEKYMVWYEECQKIPLEEIDKV